MKYRYAKIAVELICLVLVFCLFGCTNQAPAAENQLKDMEKRLMQLKAENSNLHAKTRHLDDKVLVYEKKKSIVQKKKAEENLRTVRLSPGSNMYEPDSRPVKEETLSMREGMDADDKRPVLRLSESSFSEYSTDAAASTPRPSRLPVASYQNIPLTNKGDNLGVVTSNGQMARAEEDSMELFHSAYRAYNNRDYAAAIGGFSTFLQKESNHKFADNAMFWIAECYLAKGQMFKAVGEYERLLRRYPSSEKSASSLYRIGFIYERMQDSGKAEEYYFRVVDKYPESEAARKASRRMSEKKGNARLVRTSAKR